MSKYDEGEAGEALVAELLISDGWQIMHAPDLDRVGGDGSAPMIRGNDERIMPDLHAMKNGRTVWVEVKLKRQGPQYIVKNEQNEHFIDRRNWRDYQRVRDASGAEVWLAIIEKPTATLQRELIEDIPVVNEWTTEKVNQYDGEKYGNPGVFIAQSSLEALNIPADSMEQLDEQRRIRRRDDYPTEVLPDPEPEPDGCVTEQRQTTLFERGGRR